MEQTTFLCWAFCIIMMPEGQLIHWNLFSVGGGKPKIAASDCHTIGLDCTVQLCSEPVCLSFNWLLHGCQPIRCIVAGMWAGERTNKLYRHLLPVTRGQKPRVHIESARCALLRFEVIQNVFRVWLPYCHCGIVQSLESTAADMNRDNTPPHPSMLATETPGEGSRQENRQWIPGQSWLITGVRVWWNTPSGRLLPAHTFMTVFRAHQNMHKCLQFISTCYWRLTPTAATD